MFIVSRQYLASLHTLRTYVAYVVSDRKQSRKRLFSNTFVTEIKRVRNIWGLMYV